MRSLMKQKFLSINYKRDLFSKLQNLEQGKKAVVKYTEEFFLVQARSALDELKDEAAHKY